MHIIGSILVSSEHLPGLSRYYETFGHRVSLSPRAQGDTFELMVQLDDGREQIEPPASPMLPATTDDATGSEAAVDATSCEPNDTPEPPIVESAPLVLPEEPPQATPPSQQNLIAPTPSTNALAPIGQNPDATAATPTTSEPPPDNGGQAFDGDDMGDSLPPVTPPELVLAPSPAGPTAQLLPPPETTLKRVRIADLRGNEGSMVVLFGNSPVGEKVTLEGSHAERRTAQRMCRQFIPVVELELTLREIHGRMRCMCRAVDVIAALSAFLPPAFFIPD